MNMLAKAIAIASLAFQDKEDKSGRPYILHCLQVMHTVEQRGADDELMSIAVLHDLLEDCPSWTAKELQDEGFSVRVITALGCLTHLDGEDYGDYIRRVSTNHDAVQVKIADLEHNSLIFRMKGLRPKDFKRIEKYHRAYAFLTGGTVEDE